MKLPKELLLEIIKESENFFCEYKRISHLSEEDVIKETSDLYPGKEVVLIKNVYEIKNILKHSEKPWVYHYSSNLNWVLFFNKLYQKMWVYDYIDEDNDLEEIYLKTCRLEIIFNHVDGIIEKDDIIYLVKDDIDIIKNNIVKWKI